MTHGNLLMNIENKVSSLLGGFLGGSNTPATLPATIGGWQQAFEPLNEVINKIAPNCKDVQTTSHGLLSNIFNNVLGTVGI